MLSHPKFRDVRMEVLKRFYIKEKDAWNLKIRWWHRRGWMLSQPYRITIPASKFKEFSPVGLTAKGTIE